MFLGLLMLVFVDLLELLPPLLLKNALDAVIEGHPYREVLRFAVIYLGVHILQGFGRWGWRVFLIRSSMYAGRDLRGDFAFHLFGLPMSFYDKNRVGDLMARANGDVETIRQFLGPGLLTFADAFFYVSTVPVAMYFLSPKLTLITLLPLLLIPFIAWKMQRTIHDRYKASQDQFSEIAAMAQENLNGIRVVKAFAREETQHHRFRKLGEEYIRRNLRLSRVQSSFGPLMDFIASLGIVLLIWVGGKYVGVGAITLGTFVAFQRYIQKMIWPMMALGFAANFYQRSLASSERMKEILRQKTDIISPTEPRLPAAIPGPFSKTAGRIEVRNLNFAFPGKGSSQQVLKNLSLTVEPGMRAAFVGKIGSGKSALFSLIPRIYPAPFRSIFVDGVPVEEWPLDVLRSQIGFVSQDVFLFSESVFDNIGFGLTSAAWSADQRERAVFQASEMAAVDAEIRGLSNGFSTLLGERGVNLSGGQKQRVALARALAIQPPILILDDTLSAVDVRTEEQILRNLRSRPGKNTELIAAHRISTVKDADLIFVLDKGELVESGTHAQLIRQSGGVYAHFYEEQRLKEDLESYMLEMDRKLGIDPKVSEEKEVLKPSFNGGAYE